MPKNKENLVGHWTFGTTREEAQKQMKEVCDEARQRTTDLRKELEIRRAERGLTR